MSKGKIKLNMRGLNELMKSPEMQAHLDRAGSAVASAAGSGYAHRTHVADYVAITNVYAETKEAKRENSENNTLLKAVGSAGLPISKR